MLLGTLRTSLLGNLLTGKRTIRAGLDNNIIILSESKNPKVLRTKNGQIMLLSKFAVYYSKKSKFIKEQEAGGLLSNLGINAPLNKIPLLGSYLF